MINDSGEFYNIDDHVGNWIPIKVKAIESGLNASSVYNVLSTGSNITQITGNYLSSQIIFSLNPKRLNYSCFSRVNGQVYLSESPSASDISATIILNSGDFYSNDRYNGAVSISGSSGAVGKINFTENFI